LHLQTALHLATSKRFLLADQSKFHRLVLWRDSILISATNHTGRIADYFARIPMPDAELLLSVQGSYDAWA
jgi:hypothetical protein